MATSGYICCYMEEGTMTATQTLTPSDFLLARIDDDERRAQSAGHGCGYLHEHNAGWVEVELPADHNVRPSYELDFIRRFDPEYILTQCAAKRAIVKSRESFIAAKDQGPSESLLTAAGVAAGLDYAIRVLAAAHAAHKDYRAEWAV